eukprot:TRINITY_DN1820_c0_g1_i2.p1 TRINITY_DN1820_c0_g1~~TRINITY_DN1820_c0_g1_i2.p1  ORF type:complete len:1099 (-),score=201.16 TRINITY_DN1820_c0_g1_i2:1209-4505(-)
MLTTNCLNNLYSNVGPKEGQVVSVIHTIDKAQKLFEVKLVDWLGAVIDPNDVGQIHVHAVNKKGVEQCLETKLRTSADVKFYIPELTSMSGAIHIGLRKFPFEIVIEPFKFHVELVDGDQKFSAGDTIKVKVHVENSLIRPLKMIALLVSPKNDQLTINPQLISNTEYLFQYNCIISGTYVLYVYCAEKSFDSVDKLVCDPIEFTVAPDEVIEPKRCVMIGEGLSYHSASEQFKTFSIDIRDKFGNGLLPKGRDVKVSVDIRSDAGVIAPHEIHAVDDEIFVNYRTTKEGLYSINVNINGIPILGSPRGVLTYPNYRNTVLRLSEIQAGTSSKSILNVSENIFKSSAGDLIKFKLQSYDDFGNKQSYRTCNIAAYAVNLDVDGWAPVELATRALADGTYEVYYIPEKTGKYRISILNSLLYGDNNDDGDGDGGGDNDDDVVSTPMTRYSGNNVSPSTPISPIMMSPNMSQLRIPERIKRKMFSPTKSSSHPRRRKRDANDRLLSFTFNVTCGPLSIERSFLKFNPSSDPLLTVGKEVSYIISMRDVFGNIYDIDDCAYSLSLLNEVEGSVDERCEYVSNGDYNLSVTPFFTGNITIRVDVHRNNQIEGTPLPTPIEMKNVKPGKVSGSLCQLNQFRAIVYNTDQPFTLSVRARDKYGNTGVMDIGTVVVTVDPPRGLNYDPRIEYDSEEKLHIFKFIPTITGNYSILITIDGELIAGTPFIAKVAPGRPRYIMIDDREQLEGGEFPAGKVVEISFSTYDSYKNQSILSIYDHVSVYDPVNKYEHTVHTREIDSRPYYFVKFFPTIAARHTFHLLLYGEVVEKINITTVHGSFTSKYDIQIDDNITTDNIHLHPIFIKFFDDFTNPIPVNKLSPTLKLSCKEKKDDVIVLKSRRDDPYIHSFALPHLELSTRYQLELQVNNFINNHKIPLYPGIMRFKNSLVYKPNVGLTHEEVSIYVVPKDSYNNYITEYKEDLRCSIDGIQIPVQKLKFGDFIIKFTPNIAKQYNISILSQTDNFNFVIPIVDSSLQSRLNHIRSMYASNSFRGFHNKISLRNINRRNYNDLYDSSLREFSRIPIDDLRTKSLDIRFSGMRGLIRSL